MTKYAIIKKTRLPNRFWDALFTRNKRTRLNDVLQSRDQTIIFGLIWDKASSKLARRVYHEQKILIMSTSNKSYPTAELDVNFNSITWFINLKLAPKAAIHKIDNIIKNRQCNSYVMLRNATPYCTMIF